VKYPPDIQRILEDRESGSVALLNRLLDALEQELHRSRFHPEPFYRLVSGVCKELRHFAAIGNFLAPLTQTSEQPGVGGIRSAALRYIEDYRAYWEGSSERIADHFLRQYAPAGMTLMTHSHSQTVLTLLEKLHVRGIRFRVLQTLSTPGEEGRIACDRMKQSGIAAELIRDEQTDEAMKMTGLVVMGCDALMPEEFLNKVGTRSILERARERKIRAVLVTESRKKITRPEWKSEVNPGPLFGWIPLDLVGKVLTEE